MFLLVATIFETLFSTTATNNSQFKQLYKNKPGYCHGWKAHLLALVHLNCQQSHWLHHCQDV